MRVFILCTGRTGSNTFSKACQHITNYTSGHETLTKEFGNKRFDYKDWHIEADNRLSWQLGTLDKHFPDHVFYVHFKRDTNKVISSFEKRFYQPASIIDAFSEGIRKVPPEELNKQERTQACIDYIDTVNDNIECFIANKKNAMTISIENIKDEFPIFWNKIGAEGDLKKALNEFNVKYNASKSRKILFLYELKLAVLKRFKQISLAIHK